MAKHGGSSGVLFRWLAVALVAVTALLAAPEAFAQDPFSDFFGGLFGGGGGGGGGSQHRAPRQSEQPRMRRIIPHQESRTPTYWRRDDAERVTTRRARRTVETSSGGGGGGGGGNDSASGSASSAPAEKPEVAANYFVATMGDTFALLLANGLEETFADRPEIGVLKKAKESSGLVRDDFYNWTQAARDIAGATPKPDVAVIMLGSNDRQPLRDGDKTEEPFSPRWRELYTARVDAILAIFHEKKIPVVWVGLPVMKNESYSADMAKLNEIYREEVSKAGGAFVDIWEALADERGQFSAFGPDINGQIVKLRTADGVHVTDAGALSVAHFVAGDIKKLYETAHPGGLEPPKPTAAAPGETPGEAAPGQPAPGQASTGQAPTGPAAPPIVFRSPVKAPSSDAPALPERPAIGPVQALSPAPAASGATELARPTPKPAAASADAASMARHVFIEGGDPPPRQNRADDWSWKTQAP
jgi:hypothetical protein